MRYEFMHDTVAKQIFGKASTESQMRRKVERFIHERYEAFQERDLHLSREDLNYIHPYLKQVNIPKEQAQFIKGQRARVARIRQRRRMTVAGVIILLSAISVISLSLWNRAQRQTRIAETQTKIAEDQTKQALLSDSLANQRAEEAILLRQAEELARIQAQLQTDTVRQERDRAISLQRRAERLAKEASDALLAVRTFASTEDSLAWQQKANNTLDLLMERGKSLFRRGEFDAAHSFFQTAGSIRPSDELREWSNMALQGSGANSDFDWGMSSRALSRYERIIDFQPKNSFALNRIREINRAKSAYDHATSASLDSLQIVSARLPLIPSEIAFQTSLEWVDLSANLLKALSTSLTSLENLRYLNLSSNQITRISEHANDLDQLRDLDLSSNQLASLPGDIGGMKRLKKLNVSFNNITSIHSKIGKLDRLKTLDLSRALLHESARHIFPIRAQLSDLDGNRHALGCHYV